MPATIHDILGELRENVRDNRTIGDRFERLIANYLVTDPQYADRLEDVWLWSEWPDRSGKDIGIDLVAKERATGEYWAIQCKFYLPETRLSKHDLDSFFTASGKRFATNEGECTFSNRLIVSTTDLWSSEAEKALENQQIPVERLRVQISMKAQSTGVSLASKTLQILSSKLRKVCAITSSKRLMLLV